MNYKRSRTHMEFPVIEPLSEGEHIAIMYQLSDLHAPYACVSIASIIRHAAREHHYDIVILCYNMAAKTKRTLLDYVQQEKKQKGVDVSLRFYDVGKVVEPWREKLPTTEFFSDVKFPKILMCSYWFAAHIFPRYEKVIRVGADTLMKTDIAQLYHEDLGENWIGAVRDAGMPILLRAGDLEDYYKRKFGVEKEEIFRTYINADVQVLNLTEWRKHGIGEKLLETGADTQNGAWLMIEQDVVNYVCRGHIRYFGYAWNCFPHSDDVTHPYWCDIMNAMEPDNAQEWKEALEAPSIVHFMPCKPWHDSTAKFADEWWKYARETPYYEILIQRLHTNVANDTKQMHRKRTALQRKLIKQKILRWLAVGRRKRRCMAKISELEERINKINNHLKSSS